MKGMALHGKASPGSIEHGNVSSDEHRRSKAINAEKPPRVIVKMPEPDILSERAFKELQIGQFQGGKVTLSGIDGELNAWATALPNIRRRSGSRWVKVSGSKLKAALQRDTITFPNHLSQCMAKTFSASDFIQAGQEAVKKFEALTGRRVQGFNWHLDTKHFHIDLWSTDVEVPLDNNQPFVCKSLGRTCYTLGPTVAIPARNELAGLTDTEAGTTMAKAMMARNLKRYMAAEGQKPSDSGFLGWDLAVGSHLDDFIGKRVQDKDPDFLFDETERARRRRKKVEEVATVEELKAENLRLNIKVEQLTTKLDKALEANMHMKERMDSMAQTIDMLVLNAKGKDRG